MASGRQYLDFILDQLSSLQDVSYKAMMGEYILYYQGKIIGGIYDDRLLVKQTESAKKLLPEAPLAVPYEGAREMIAVEDVDDRELLCDLLQAMARDLPAAKRKE